MELQKELNPKKLVVNYEEITKLLSKKEYDRAEMLLNTVTNLNEDYYYLAYLVSIKKEEQKKVKKIGIYFMLKLMIQNGKSGKINLKVK